MSHDRKSILPQRAGVTTWLASHNKGFHEELTGIQPEFLLNSIDAIQAIGSESICTALLNQAESISYQQRHSSLIGNNLFRLVIRRDGL